MKLFSILAVSAAAVHSCSGTFTLAKNFLEKNVESAEASVSRLVNSGGTTSESFDIHIHRQPVCKDCQPVVASASGTHPVSAPVSVVQAKGRYYYYPTSYYYPSPAYYYYPSYAVPSLSHALQHQQQHSSSLPLSKSSNVLSAQRRTGLVYAPPSSYNHGYFVYPSGLQGLQGHKDLKPVRIEDYYHPQLGGYHPLQLSPVPISVYPPFSKLVRAKSGRPYVSPANRRNPHWGGLKNSSSTDGTKSSSTTTTTEAPVEQEQQQEEEQQTEEPPTKGSYY